MGQLLHYQKLASTLKLNDKNVSYYSEGHLMYSDHWLMLLLNVVAFQRPIYKRLLSKNDRLLLTFDYCYYFWPGPK